ncbi:site-specific integrase [Prescottella equi]|uniref:Integrase n=1 Tax=Rhodococcus phage REQ2 TaxID=1109713 RepID=G9FGY1_9CAUD|nr:site-specific integrase [Prescottella equi]YP_005087082.1 integrase [Rhodococcus phage REQ2]AEV51892.1 phage integrase [Rhodococcus phage REQ2]
MAKRNQLPPQIKKIQLAKREGGKPAVRYQLTVDVGLDPETGRRKQYRKRVKTEDEARTELSTILSEVSRGTYVHASNSTVADVIDNWLLSKHSLKPSTAHGYKVVLAPVRAELGELAVQKLTRRDLDKLIVKLRAGGLAGEQRETRKPWKARTVNYMLTVLAAALESEVKQGTLVRNVAKLVDKLPEADERSEMKTWTPAQVEQFLASVDGDPYSHAWWLALCGLRRGEISGLRWEDVDIGSKTLTVSTSRVSFAKTISEGTPKSKRSARTLPMPDDLVTALKAAKKRQTENRLALGGGWRDSGYVVADAEGNPPTPNTLTYWWRRSVEKAGVPAIRLHDARHTCATLMHLRGVPIAVVAAWMGHASAAFTLSTYAHSQDPALLQAASSAPVVTIRDNLAT